jgi:hypothetical protein
MLTACHCWQKKVEFCEGVRTICCKVVRQETEVWLQVCGCHLSPKLAQHDSCRAQPPDF